MNSWPAFIINLLKDGLNVRFIPKSTSLILSLFLLGGSVVSASSFNGSSSESQNNVNPLLPVNKAIQAKIDSSIIGKDRDVIAASGELITGPGNQELPMDQQVIESTTPNDSSIISPYSSIPPQTGGSGPYRRVYSNDGYSWISTYVTLPGGSNVKDNNSAAPYYDTAYVYTGGWGATDVGVDAGMQHSTMYDDWAPSTLANGQMVTSTPRYKSGQDIYLKFYVTATNEVTLAVSGITTTGESKTTTIVRSGVSGWTKDGSKMRLKRMTTIGQKNGESFTTGSFMKGVHWHDITIGYYNSTGSLVYTGWGSSQTGGTYNNDSAHVSVNYINAGEETVNIQL
ncbi:hypothetical protein [Paenibacillus sediminis]|uniref:hypothetical protein n=1 Tax=Paenibacillus sediminis TaxID=664909 RepID=UPI0039ED288A